MPYSGSPYSGSPYSGEGGGGEPGEPIEIGGIVAPRSATGYVIDGINALVIGGVETDQEAPGFDTPPDEQPLYLRPIKVGALNNGAVAHGFNIPDVVNPADPDDERPYIDIDGVLVSTAISVDDFPDALEISVQPQWNAPGEAQFTTEFPGPDENQVVVIKVGGIAQLEGHVTTVSRAEVSPQEEAGELASAKVEGLAGEWRHVLVLPDFGAQDVDLLSEPVQDERVFDWTMNGLGTDDADGVSGINIIGSHSVSMVDGALSGQFPMPDVWPDPWARWMWVSPMANSQRRGWCYFRVPFSTGANRRRKVQVWGATTDYMDVWVDGVQVLTCDTAYVAQHLELETTGKFHLATIRAFNESGRSGALFSILPVDDDGDGLYGAPFMNSRSGWKSLAYPNRTFRLNPGQVLRRLRLEAARRDTYYVRDWKFSFNESVDSAGRAWPANDPITLDVGMTYLDVLDRLAEDLIDWRTSPTGRTLDAFVKGEGSGVSRSAPWIEGVNLTSRDVEVTIDQWS